VCHLFGNVLWEGGKGGGPRSSRRSFLSLFLCKRGDEDEELLSGGCSPFFLLFRGFPMEGDVSSQLHVPWGGGKVGAIQHFLLFIGNFEVEDIVALSVLWPL